MSACFEPVECKHKARSMSSSIFPPTTTTATEKKEFFCVFSSAWQGKHENRKSKQAATLSLDTVSPAFDPTENETQTKKTFKNSAQYRE
jgi:hypothetical protein